MKTQTERKPIVAAALTSCLVLVCGCLFLSSVLALGTPLEGEELALFDKHLASALAFVDEAEGLHNRFLHDLDLLSRVKGLDFYGVCRAIGRASLPDVEDIDEEDEDDDLSPNPFSGMVGSTSRVIKLFVQQDNVSAAAMGCVAEAMKELTASTIHMNRVVNKLGSACEGLYGLEGLLEESVSLLGFELDAHCQSGVRDIMKNRDVVNALYLDAFDGDVCPNSISRVTPEGRDPASWERLRQLMWMYSP